MHRIQGYITRLVLPLLLSIDISWMQGSADSRSSQKFLSEAKYNQGWYKRESIFLQKKDRLSFLLYQP